MDNNLNIEYNNLLKKAKRFFRSKKKLASLV